MLNFGKIEEKEAPLMGYEVMFSINEDTYLGSLVMLRGIYGDPIQSEFMVFPVENGKIDWVDVYMDRDMPLTEKELVRQVKRFYKKWKKDHPNEL